MRLVKYHIQLACAFAVLLLVALPDLTQAQEIDFGSFSNYTVTVETEPGYETLQFGTILSGSGLASVNLGDNPGMAVVGITGVQYLDVMVTINKPDALVSLEPGENDEIPFTSLQAAYANHGSNNYLQAKIINGLQARFPILERQHHPPGPPPTPPIDGVTPPTETAYIYLWGTINVGSVAAGEYAGSIYVTVEYN